MFTDTRKKIREMDWQLVASYFTVKSTDIFGSVPKNFHHDPRSFIWSINGKLYLILNIIITIKVVIITELGQRQKSA